MLALERIADALEQATPTAQAPNYQRPLEDFADFDWASINATVDQVDRYGAAIVSWRGQQFIRRSPSNKFGEAIWFSRHSGKTDDGENKYERLVTFKPVSRVVEPVPDKIQRVMYNRSTTSN